MWEDAGNMKNFLSVGRKLGKNLPELFDLLVSPASRILNKWFESEPLKATLATDSVIGAMISPNDSGSGYILLHHVMGELNGVKGAWGYVKGGMGKLSEAIARSAVSEGAEIFTSMPVSQINYKNERACGVTLENGQEISSDIVLSNATAETTFLKLINKGVLSEEFIKAISQIEYTSPVTKINVAVDCIPNFVATPNLRGGTMPHHQATIHLNCEQSSLIDEAYLDMKNGKFSKLPMIEMTIPSSLDQSLAPPGKHVVQLFTQYTPYYLNNDQEWTEKDRQSYCDTVFNSIEAYAPGFKDSVIGYEVLVPQDLENIFGLTGGNIFHGAMSLDQLYFNRPVTMQNGYRTPVKSLYMCGSSTHPGGGVMGAAGKLAALQALKDMKNKNYK